MPTLAPIACPIQRFEDARTGHEVWKISPWDDAHCAATYMYFQAFSGDERYAVFASDRTGDFELYRLDLESQELVQVSRRRRANETAPGAAKARLRSNVHPNGRELYYVDDGELWKTDLYTLEQGRVLARPTGKYRSFRWTNVFSGDGQQAIGSFVDAQGRAGFAAAPLSGGGGGGPVRELCRIDDPSLSSGHLLAAPLERLLISFNIAPDRQNDANQRPDLRARCWGWDEATGRINTAQLLMPPGHRATHEYWGRSLDGQVRLYFHKKTVPTWTPTSIASVDITGGDLREHFFSPDRKLGHSAVTRDGRWLVSDVQDERGNELYLVDLIPGRSQVLCWPDSTLVDGVIGHVHPSFSPSGRYVIYTSDQSGKAAVFVVPLR